MREHLSSAWDRFWFEPTSPAPICLFRICYGLLCFASGLLLLPDFLTWFGPNGVAPVELVELVNGPRFSLLLWMDASENATLAVLALYILFSLCLTVGLFTRFSSIVVWILLLSISLRNPKMYLYVNTLLRLYGLGIILAPAGAMYSVDSWLRRRSGKVEPPLCAPWAQRLIQFQVTMVYFRAFWTKLDGQLWWDGTAVYYSIHCYDISRRHMPELFNHLFIYKFLTWGTLAVEFSLWSLIWYRPWRYRVLLGGMCLHLGIQWFLNLDLLEYGIMSGYVTFLHPQDLEGVLERIKSKFRKTHE